MLLALSKSYTAFTIWSYAPSISSLLLLSNGILSTIKCFFVPTWAIMWLLAFIMLMLLITLIEL